MVLMKSSLFVRELTDAERAVLEQGLRSPEAFTLRRSQILLASTIEKSPRQIAEYLGCTAQTVRNVIYAFEQQELECLQQQSSRPITMQLNWSRDKRERLRSLLQTIPRSFGKSRSTWTLELLAQVCKEQGITPEQVSGATIHHTLKAMSINWKRAKEWIGSPDLQYAKKSGIGTA